tara:strand:+ start:180 stop:476 length:297 start_codon:yes stop_codon:yes gene_type:complete
MEIIRTNLVTRPNALCTKVELRSLVLIVCVDDGGPSLNHCLRDFLGLNNESDIPVCPDYIIIQQRYQAEQGLFGSFEAIHYGEGYRVYIEGINGVRRQ